MLVVVLLLLVLVAVVKVLVTPGLVGRGTPESASPLAPCSSGAIARAALMGVASAGPLAGSAGGVGGRLANPSVPPKRRAWPVPRRGSVGIGWLRRGLAARVPGAAACIVVPGRRARRPEGSAGWWAGGGGPALPLCPMRRLVLLVLRLWLPTAVGMASAC